MARWLLLALALASNTATVLVALAPSVVTYAEILPADFGCSTCTREAQAAVVRAAASGRAQVQSLVASNTLPLLGLAMANLVVFGLFMWLSRQNTQQVDSLDHPGP